MKPSFDRIVLDGLNLGLTRGTGIASYGGNLARLLRGLHFGVDVLYDRPVLRKADPLLKELSFYADARRKRGASRRTRWLDDVAQAVPWGAALVQGVTASRVQSDMVLARDALPNHPEDGGILSIGDVFQKASASAALLRRPLRVRLPAGAALHLTYAIPMVAVDAPTIMTVHDVIPLRLPRAVEDPRFRFLKHLRMAAESADHIIAISESTKEDLLHAIRLPPEKITVTYQPVCPLEGFDPDLAAEMVARVHGLAPGRYFLFVGAIEPKKNLPRLIEAYLLSGSASPLVIAGPAGWAVEDQLAHLGRGKTGEGKLPEAVPNAGPRSEKIRLLGYVQRAHVAALMSQARALLLPSLYEGFGLPMVEAMQLGVPVLAGSSGALPEIAGGAALLVDPYDVEAIARGIRQLDADTDLRNALRIAGPENVKRFSVSACTERLVSAYHAAGIEVPTRSQPGA